ncbi:MAG: hypothetical protein OEM61_11270, partial [Desulfobacteraceae bacterium]|nr:hypothetical protein [Desulfobacteraceae bacterium]
MKKDILRFIMALSIIVFYSCTSSRSTVDRSVEGPTAPRNDVQTPAIQGSVFGPVQEFVGSPYEE